MVCPAAPRAVTCRLSGRDRRRAVTAEGVGSVFVESSDDQQIIQRVAALDIGKAEVVCCVRLPAADGGRRVAGGVDALDDGHVVV